jgi:hypothetical protein
MLIIINSLNTACQPPNAIKQSKANPLLFLKAKDINTVFIRFLASLSDKRGFDLIYASLVR